MCLVWEPTVNNTVPFGSELAVESQIQRIPFPKSRRKAGPPRPAGEGRGQALARYLAWPAPSCTSPAHPAGHGAAVTETPSSSSPPPLPLDRGPPRQAGERSRGWAAAAAAGAELSGAEPPSWPGGKECGQSRAAVFITTINSSTMQGSSGGKGEKMPRLPSAERHPASPGGYQRGVRSRPSRILVNQIYVQI